MVIPPVFDLLPCVIKPIKLPIFKQMANVAAAGVAVVLTYHLLTQPKLYERHGAVNYFIYF